MDTLQLGGNIQLTGFSSLEPGQMIVIKKIVGNYARKLGTLAKKLEHLSLTLTETNGEVEVNVELMDDGNPVRMSSSNKNLFIALDAALKLIEASFS